MGYAVAIVLVVLLVAAFIGFMVTRAATKGGARSGDSSARTGEDQGPGIGGDKETPFLDTDQHAGRQRGGETVGAQDAVEHGGTGRPPGGYASVGDGEDAAHVRREGEAEGARRV